MRLRFAGATWRGRAVDLRGSGVDAAAVYRAIRDRGDDRVRSRAPGPVHEHVGLLTSEREFSREACHAAVARSRGLGRSERVVEATRPDDPADARRAVAAATAAVEGRREDVSRARGRLEARRAIGAPTAAARDDLRAAARALSEAETERAAAEEALASARRRARGQRDERAAALRAVDGRRNERKRLAAAVADAIAAARRAVPDCGLTPQLAAVRAARVSAPVVLVGGPFDRATRAAACLDAPVVLADPP
ncbi:DUF7856 family protein [Halocalculus aciditolerans]|uniref:Uncharacterized protein n=1 Tax=Halocalculus aciditolerans TaxID=1383812 RepID=A0A830F7S5_9EURY|nr:hypothetical protein [Halocalculus aciditolerans]GGL48253.1 hypothetical protein GCM10009039_03110 [Halocalculus aciditolerans]